VNWTQASRPKQKFQTKSATAKALAPVLIGPPKKAREAVLIVESDKQNRLDINAYLGSEESKHILNLKKNGFGLQLLESCENGKILVGAINDRLFIGTMSSGQIETLAQLSYDFFSFDTPDLITCLDTKVTSRNSGSQSRVNILVGGARGAIYLYHDALSRLQAISRSKSEKDTIQAQKYHWHRKAVHSVKWSHDGKL
jgi:NET1-associated nuclear protein 1 (U3 small nucleolar RNA-associated protein 17)